MERELDEAANRTAYFLAVHSGKPGFVLKTEHPKDVCRHGSLRRPSQGPPGSGLARAKTKNRSSRTAISWVGRATPIFNAAINVSTD